MSELPEGLEGPEAAEPVGPAATATPVPAEVRADELLPLVYDELRRWAAVRMAREPAGHTLQPTALVHEVWLRLGGIGQQRWNSRGHFLAAAAEAMRRILIEAARRKQAQRRGSGREREELEEHHLVLERPADEVLGVNEALEQLSREDPEAAELVKLRYFVGLSLPEAAEALGISPRSADRLWAYARTWLKAVLEAEPARPSPAGVQPASLTPERERRG